MSADLMLTCDKRGENFKTGNGCFHIDETSMGCPWTDFGKMLASHSDATIDDAFIEKVCHWLAVLETGDYFDPPALIEWLKAHKGEHLEYECW